jgi:hypothetical protein
VLIATSAGLCLCLAFLMPARVRERLGVRNHRGVRVPATLGITVYLASVGAQAVAGIAAGLSSSGAFTAATWGILAGTTLVFAAGLFDDLTPGGPRGLRGHAHEVVRGRPTPGLVKMVAAVGGAVVVALTVPGRTVPEVVLGIMTMAGAANLWNGLDVAPGRAAKAFLAAALVLLPFSPPALLVRMLGAAIPAGWLDVRERAMLGDGGSNVLGFMVGVGLYATLGTAGLAAAAVVVVGLNLLAETVTLSRVIAAVPALRWADGLGRIQAHPDLGRS